MIALLFAGAPVAAQEALSPLPPPVTRSLYRAQWFEFLSAFSENDTAAAGKALDGMVRAARKVGVHHLSDFSRTAVVLGRRAEKAGQPDRAARAYDAALKLDGTNPDALAARLSFLVRHGRVLEGLRALPSSAAAFFASREPRVAVLSSLGLWIAMAAVAALAGLVLALAVRHFPRAAHDIGETARRAFGNSAALPLALGLFGLPLFVGLGPMWLILYWGALFYAYTGKRERVLLVAGFFVLALVPSLLAWITGENIRQRSPLFVAAVDLAERREDASAEDGLRQAAAVFPEDPDVWFLLGVFAERAGDYGRAQSEYGRAVQADPGDYRPILNRGNVRFTEGDYGEAIRDYIEAAKRTPRAEIFYNLALARGEAYDFDGQAQAMAKAREISASQVNTWTANPTLSRVVPAGYSIARARERIAKWNGEPKSRRLPGHGSSARAWRELLSPWSLAPIGAWMLAMLLERLRRRRGLADECHRCGRAFCNRCRRFGDPSLYCPMCARTFLRKEDVDIEIQVAETRATQRRALWRERARRIASLLLPGSGAILGERPVAGAVTLFLFFLGLAALVVDNRFFDPLALPPAGSLRITMAAGAALALLTWVRAQFSARRAPDGS